MEESYGAIILAGGRSDRMNYPKIYLEVGGKSFLKKIAEEYNFFGVKNICLVINKEFCEGEWKGIFEAVKRYVSVVEKTGAEQGRFHSLKLGIKNVLNSDFVFIQNADNPFVNKEIIRALQKNRCSFGYTQLFHQGQKGHPILISKKIIQLISSLQGGEHNLRDILKEFPKTDVEVHDKRILANINTKKDYEEYIFERA